MFSKIAEIYQRGRTIVPDKYRKKQVVYFLVLLGLTMDNFNVTGAMTTEYSIEQMFNVSSTTASWTLSAYALTLGSFIIFFGRVGDMIGPHNAILLGSSGSAVFSLLTAVPQPSIVALIVFRAFQGIFAAALMPAGYAIAANYFHGEQLGMAIRFLAIVLITSFGVGTIAGGAFSLTKIGYQGFFYFTCGSSTFCSVTLYFLIIPVKESKEKKNMHVKDLDFIGVIFFVAGLLLFIFGLTEAGISWNSPKVYVTIPIGVLLVLTMLFYETVFMSRYKKKFEPKEAEAGNHSNQSLSISVESGPEKGLATDLELDSNRVAPGGGKGWLKNTQLLFPAEVFKITNFFPLIISLFSLYISFIDVLTSLLQYDVLIAGDSTLMASVKCFPMAVATLCSALVYSPKIPKKLGFNNTIRLCALACLGGSFLIWRTDYKVENEYWKYHFVALIVMGFFCNLYFMVYLNAIMSETPLHLQGVVSGIFQTSGQVGVSIASAILSTILGPLEKQPRGSPEFENQFQKFRNGFCISIAACGIFFIASLFIKDLKVNVAEHDEHDEESTAGTSLEVDESIISHKK